MTEQTFHHIPRTLAADAHGWVVTEYRGASVRTWRHASILYMQGHPYDGKEFGQVVHCLRLIDAWIDRQILPSPYVQAASARQG